MNKIGRLLAWVFTLASFLWWIGAFVTKGTFSTGMYPYDCTREFLGFCTFTSANRDTILGGTMIGFLFLLPIVMIYVTGLIFVANGTRYLMDRFGASAGTEELTKVKKSVIFGAAFIWPITLIVFILVAAIVAMCMEFYQWGLSWFEKTASWFKQ